MIKDIDYTAAKRAAHQKYPLHPIYPASGGMIAAILALIVIVVFCSVANLKLGRAMNAAYVTSAFVFLVVFGFMRRRRTLYFRRLKKT